MTDVPDPTVEAVAESLRLHGDSCTRANADYLARVAVAALQLTEETKELADGMGSVTTNWNTGETTTQCRPCTRLRRVVGPWRKVQR